jgi:hypothetical protein
MARPSCVEFPWSQKSQLHQAVASMGRMMARSAAVATVRLMAGKKDYDATKNLPEGEPTQVLPKGTKTGLPKRGEVFAALQKVARKASK